MGLSQDQKYELIELVRRLRQFMILVTTSGEVFGQISEFETWFIQDFT